MKKSKRDYSRVKVCWPAIIFSSKGSIDGEIADISLNGALVRCLELPDPAETVELHFMMPEYDSLAMTVSAEIIRLSSNCGDNSSVLSDVGVRFTDIAEDDLRFLSNTVLF